MTSDAPLPDGEPPFIVTAELDPSSFEWLDALRRRYFPPERNFLSAHLTLFHKLDVEGVAIVRQIVADTARGALPMRFVGLRQLGRGVAIDVAAPELVALRARCAAALAGRLTPQDRQPLKPHVTVQNKVDPAVAGATYRELAESFVTREGISSALLVWRYLGGPWAFAERLKWLQRPDV